MAKIETYECDQCKTQRKDSNHWWKVSEVRQDGNLAGTLVAKWETRFRLPVMPEMQAVKNLFDVGPEAHLCGADCVTQWLSKNLL